MIIKKVNRYWCEWCKKSGGSASHMSKHERHCTMNPNRQCRVCKMVESPATKPVSELVALLPDHRKYSRETPQEQQYYDKHLSADANTALSNLRKACHNCPACILAALRQAHIPVLMVTDFNFTNEMKAVWEHINDEDRAAQEFATY